MRFGMVCGLLAAVSCTMPTSASLPAAHRQVIETEWAIAGNMLQDRLDLSWQVEPDWVAAWIPHDGPISHPDYPKGVNGLFVPSERSIKWNIRTPHVLRHEAGHAILYAVGHPCRSCISINGTTTPTMSIHPGCPDWLVTYCSELLGVDQ